MYQLVQRQGLRWSASDRIDPQWLPELVQIRQDVKSGKLDLNAITNRLVKLSQRVVGADGAGVWLFTHDDVFLCTGAGNAPNDERLRLEVISKLAGVCPLRSASVPRLARPTAISARDDASDPSGTTSLLVEPIYQGHYIAGALAAFSDELNSFTEQDATNFHLLAGVLTQALSKATGARLEQSVALDPAAMLQLIERIIPTLQRMLESEENARQSAQRFSKSVYQLPAGDLDTKPLQELHQPGEETSAAEVPGGGWTEHEQAPPAPPADSTTCPVLEGTNVPRIEVPRPFAAERPGSTSGRAVRDVCSAAGEPHACNGPGDRAGCTDPKPIRTCRTTSPGKLWRRFCGIPDGNGLRDRTRASTMLYDRRPMGSHSG